MALWLIVNSGRKFWFMCKTANLPPNDCMAVGKTSVGSKIE